MWGEEPHTHNTKQKQLQEFICKLIQFSDVKLYRGVSGKPHCLPHTPAKFNVTGKYRFSLKCCI